jgi:hypothetical protein
MKEIKTSRWSRGGIEMGARAAYQMLVDRDQRLAYVEFGTKKGPLLLVFARGERAQQLRELSMTGTVQNPEVSQPQPLADPSEITAADRRSLNAAVRVGRKLMRRNGVDYLPVTFTETIEPMQMLFARGATVPALHQALLASGLLSPVA